MTWARAAHFTKGQPCEKRPRSWAFFWLLLAMVIGGCATYQHKVMGARSALLEGDHQEAIDRLKPLAEKPSDDQLIYLLDYAVALQQAGRYQESAKVLAKADKLAEVVDYHSISRISGSLLLSEEMVQYKGETYENVLINAVAAVNYLMLGKLESALVECRRLNEKLYRYKHEGGKNYEQNGFARYLAGIIWEADRKWADAYLDYVEAYKLTPHLSYLKEDILRTAYLAGRNEDYKKWQGEFGDLGLDPQKWRARDTGELVLIYQQGWAPRKQPRPEAPRYPMLVKTHSLTQFAELDIDNGKIVTHSQPVFSVGEVAMKTMEDDYAALVARRASGVLVKAVVADQFRQKDEGLGQLAWVLMNAADRADLRQWSTLPETFQVARLVLPAGTHSLELRGLTRKMRITGEHHPRHEITIRPGKKTFVAWRSFQ